MAGEMIGQSLRKMQFGILMLLPWVLPCQAKGQRTHLDWNPCAEGLLELVGHSVKDKYIYFAMMPWAGKGKQTWFIILVASGEWVSKACESATAMPRLPFLCVLMVKWITQRKPTSIELNGAAFIPGILTLPSCLKLSVLYFLLSCFLYVDGSEMIWVHHHILACCFGGVIPCHDWWVVMWFLRTLVQLLCSLNPGMRSLFILLSAAEWA